MITIAHKKWRTFGVSIMLIVLLHINDVRSHDHMGVPTGNQFHDSNVVHDKEHIKEHMHNIDKPIEEMTEKELEFYYFKTHDNNNDGKLDGLEMLWALTEHMPSLDQLLKEEEMTGKTPAQIEILQNERRAQNLQNFANLVDMILSEDDFDNDGYLTYVEYVLARRRRDAEYAKNNPSSPSTQT